MIVRNAFRWRLLFLMDLKNVNLNNLTREHLTALIIVAGMAVWAFDSVIRLIGIVALAAVSYYLGVKYGR